jgi:peptidoglycan/LPS O-acetylase OafA/YrhL
MILNPPKISGRSEGIDLMRGVCALAVLLFAHIIFWSDVVHQDVPPNLLSVGRALIFIFQKHGELNPFVLAFVVLSGYCIHRNGLRSRAGIRQFLIRRFFRIVPVFFLATILGIYLFGVSINVDARLAIILTGTSEIKGECLAAKLLLIPALLPVAHPCDFLGNAPSLTVMAELVLYIFYALLFWKTSHYWLQSVLIISLIVGIIVSANNIKYPILYNWWQNSSALAFLPYWWAGAAAIVPDYRKLIKKNSIRIFCAWLIFSFIANIADSAIAAELRKIVFAILIAGLIIRLEETSIPVNPLSMLGRVGYSLYAIHAPLCVMFLLWGLGWWQTLFVTVVCGIGCYLMFERPFDKFGRKITEQHSVISSKNEV